MKTKLKVFSPKPRVFLHDAKFASGHFASEEDIEKTLSLVRRLNVNRFLSEEHAILIETSINSLALSILRFSNTEWSNDYYGCVESLHEITSFLDRFFKAHKMGKYFSLKTNETS